MAACSRMPIQSILSRGCFVCGGFTGSGELAVLRAAHLIDSPPAGPTSRQTSSSFVGLVQVWRQIPSLITSLSLYSLCVDLISLSTWPLVSYCVCCLLHFTGGLIIEPRHELQYKLATNQAGICQCLTSRCACFPALSLMEFTLHRLTLNFACTDSASLRVYVGNLSWGVDSELLAPHMAAAGTVQNADVMMRRDGKSKVRARTPAGRTGSAADLRPRV